MQLPVAELALQMLDDIERGQTWDWGFWMYIQKNAYGGQGREDVDPYLDKAWVYVTDERLIESAFVGDGRRLDRMYITDQSEGTATLQGVGRQRGLRLL